MWLTGACRRAVASSSTRAPRRFCTAAASASTESASTEFVKKPPPMPPMSSNGRPMAILRPEISLEPYKNGYPWVFRSDLSNMPEIARLDRGLLCDVVASEEAGGEPIGVGFTNRSGNIVVRLMSAPGGEVDNDLVVQRVRAAVRKRIPDASPNTAKKNSYECQRLISGEADGLPGIYVDKYCTTLVVRIDTLGVCQIEEPLFFELERLLKPKVICVHKMGAAQEKNAQQGAEYTTYFHKGSDNIAWVSEGGRWFAINLMQGARGMWPFQNADGRAFVANLMKGGTVCDVYSRYGEWGVHCAASGAESVVMLEDSFSYAQLSEQNAQVNKCDNTTVIHQSDVLDELWTMGKSDLRFGCVIISPKTQFSRYNKARDSQFGRFNAPLLKGFEKLCVRAARILVPGGYIVFQATLPGEREHWATNFLMTGLTRAGKTGTIIYESGITPEHGISATQEDYWYPRMVVARVD